jgi:hypothetical protein
VQRLRSPVETGFQIANAAFAFVAKCHTCGT